MSEKEQPSFEKVMQAPMTRRALLKGLAGGAILASGLPRESAHAQEATPERHPLLKDLPPTTLSFDPKLVERSVTPITGFELNPDQARFEGLDPNNPQERLDLAIMQMFARLEAIQSEYVDLPERKLTNEEMMQNPIWQRANNAELPPTGDVEHFARLLEKRKKYRLPLWAYEPEEMDKDKFKLFKIDPKKGVDIHVLAEPPLVVSYYSASRMPAYGFTPTVSEDGKLQLGIYVVDKKFESQTPMTPQHFGNYEYALQTYGTIEELSLFGGRTDLHGLNSNFNDLRFASQGAVLFPEVMENLGGPFDTTTNYFTAAPYCKIDSSTLT